MEIILLTLTLGAIVGISDQWTCLFLLSLATRFNFIPLSSQMSFINSDIFLGATLLLSLLTNTPSLFTHVPKRFEGTINFISGFCIPITAPLFVIVILNYILQLYPDLKSGMQVLRFFDQSGIIGKESFPLLAIASVSASVITFIKVAIKRGYSKKVDSMAATKILNPRNQFGIRWFTIFEILVSFCYLFIAIIIIRVSPSFFLTILGLIILNIVSFLDHRLLNYSLYTFFIISLAFGYLLSPFSKEILVSSTISVTAFIEALPVIFIPLVAAVITLLLSRLIGHDAPG